MQGFIDVDTLLDYPDDFTKKKRVLVALNTIVGIVEHKETCTIGLASNLYTGGSVPVTTLRVHKTYQEVMDLVKAAQ